MAHACSFAPTDGSTSPSPNATFETLGVRPQPVQDLDERAQMPYVEQVLGRGRTSDTAETRYAYSGGSS
jgi:hypothetical protein